MPPRDTSSEQLLSDDIQEIISHRPHWIVRRGNIIFLLVLLSFLAFTGIIKYPDVIKGSMRLVAVNAPVLLVAKKEGKLQRLLVTNDQEVRKGQLLAFLQSTGDHRQVLALLRRLGSMESFIMKGDFSVLASDPLPSYNNLGEVQSLYQDFQNSLKETLQVLEGGYYSRKERMLQKDLEYLSDIEDNRQRQEQIVQEDYNLQKHEYAANESLARDKIIAPLELAQNKSKMLGKDQALQQIGANLINDSIDMQNKKKEIMDLGKYVADQRQKFLSSFLTLKSNVDEWVQQYVLIAPEAGKVLFTSFLEENQLLSNEQEMFYIQPEQSFYYGQMLVSQTGLGKIRKDQRVLIRVESYPSSEFGYLTGSIDYISNIPTVKDSFLIKVVLKDGLHTNYNKTIYFRNNLSAQAEVQTDNRKLLDRFWGQLKDITRK
jgi:multidrug efflux pump subunit AcrA (membrane-fusion protein)